MELTWMLVALFALLIVGAPIAIALLISGLIGYMLMIGPGAGLSALAQISFSSINVFVIIAIPLFIYMGQIMLKGEAGRDLFDLAQRATRRLPGGLVIASILASAIFAAISGSSTATAATIGSISIPEMISRGYNKRMAAGAVAVAGGLGILIPPSISFILYSLVTNTSVGALFMAGILPGILLALLYSTYTMFHSLGEHPTPTEAQPAGASQGAAKRGSSSPEGAGSAPSKAQFYSTLENAPAGGPALTIERAGRTRLRSSGTADGTFTEIPPLTIGMFFSFLMIVVVLGSIYAGLATPTEAAAIGVAYALVLTFAVKRTLGARSFWLATTDSVKTSAMILMLIVGASVFGNTLSLIRVPQNVATWLETLDLAQWQFWIAINIIYLILGMFMDAAAAILVTVPILLPALLTMHIDLVWFGVILFMNMEIGAVTPPVGMNLFVVQSLSDEYSVVDVLRGSLPYALMGLVGIALVIIFPQIALWLPSLLS